MKKTAVKLTDIQKSFGVGDIRTQVLFDINQDFKTGELSLIVGPSGCGKTTMISVIGGILEPDSGSIEVFDEKIDLMTDNDKTEFRKNNIGFIFQQHNLIPTLTIKENISIPMLINRRPEKEVEKRVMDLLEIVDLKSHANYYPRNISGGQQQRVAIARSLVMDPKLVICDEPTASLDGQTGRKIVGMLKEVALQNDRAVIVVTHDSRIFKYGDRMIKLEDGRIKSDKEIIRRNI